jgi:hypothetical protein
MLHVHLYLKAVLLHQNDKRARPGGLQT